MDLKEKRIKCGMTQKELGKIVGAKQHTVSQWETGERTPRVAMLQKVAEVLNCTTDELLVKKPERIA